MDNMVIYEPISLIIIIMDIYIYSHPGVDRISDIFKNDFQK